MHACMYVCCMYILNSVIVYHVLDIKPSNMLVNTQGMVKLCDFGVSVQVSSTATLLE